MPPKKDNKKKGGGGSGPKEIQPELYIREPVKLADIPPDSIPPSQQLSGQFYNISSQFSDWSIADENWAEPIAPENIIQLKYPQIVQAQENKPIREYLNLNVDMPTSDAGTKGGKKEVPKKGKVVEVTGETAYDEAGRALPRVFVDTVSLSSPESPPDETQHSKFDFSRDFCKTDYGIENDIFMSEVDPLVCAAFELVRRFSATLTSVPECPFLWRAIYPQLPNGRPYYNSSGKYCVKLFVAGKWRKVYVTDDVPVTASGTPALAYSSVGHELWPMLLSKAIYTVYTAFGYDKIFSEIGKPQNGKNTTDLASGFIAFALHTLTSWLPTCPMAIPTLSSDESVDSRVPVADMRLVNDDSRSARKEFCVGDEVEARFHGSSKFYRGKVLEDNHDNSFSILFYSIEEKWSFLQDISFGGCHCITAADKIRSDAFNVDEIRFDDSKYEGKFTKKIIKDLGETKEVKTEHLKQRIIKRENAIKNCTSEINKIYSEIFCFIIASDDGSRFRVFPILTVASEVPGSFSDSNYRSTSPTSKLSPSKMDFLKSTPVIDSKIDMSSSSPDSVELLVSWKLGERKSSGLESSVAEDWQFSTAVEQKWLKFSDFYDSSLGSAKFGTSVISFETRVRTGHSKELHWSWASQIVQDAPEAGKGKPPAKSSKDKKGGDAATGAALSPLGVPVNGSDAGIFPPMLLRIETKSLTDKWNEISEQPEVRTLDSSRFLSISVFLQADVCSTSGTAGSAAIESESGTPTVCPIVDDVVLVLQEVRKDEMEPLVMRVAISRQDLVVPITRTTFHVPSSKLLDELNHPNGGGEAIVFWVRLFTKSSVQMTFASTTKLELGPADNVWQASGEGSAFVLEGESSVIRNNFESVLFRTALQSQSNSVASADTGVNVMAAPNSAACSCIVDEKAMVFLFISDRVAGSYVSLVEASAGYPETLVALPRLLGNVVTFSPISSFSGPVLGQLGVTLIARCFSQNSVIPGFKWKLIVLSRKNLSISSRWVSLPLQSALTTPAPVKRFAGCYIPNNRLLLFRDQFSGVLQDAPIALKISLLPLVYGDGLDVTSIWLKVRVIKPSDRCVVFEYSARGTIPLYLIDLKQFTSANVESDQTSKKKDEKVKKGGAVSEETVDFIIECLLDENAMNIPQTWRSRFPYTYSPLLPISFGSNENLNRQASTMGVADGTDNPEVSFLMPQAESPPCAEGPEWTLDIVGGNVTSVSNDMFDLKRMCNFKNSWLESSGSDRFEKASAAYNYCAARLTISPGSEKEDSIIELLGTALSVSTDVLRTHELMLPTLPKYVEHVTSLDSNAPRLVDSKSLADLKRIESETSILVQESSNIMSALTKLNSQIRDDIKDRLDLLISTAENNTSELRSAWSLREDARRLLIKQNDSLSYLLQRADDAKQKVYAPTEDPKAKGKAKKK